MLAYADVCWRMLAYADRIILTYCTGGIRCEKANAWIIQVAAKNKKTAASNCLFLRACVSRGLELPL